MRSRSPIVAAFLLALLATGFLVSREERLVEPVPRAPSPLASPPAGARAGSPRVTSSPHPLADTEARSPPAPPSPPERPPTGEPVVHPARPLLADGYFGWDLTIVGRSAWAAVWADPTFDFSAEPGALVDEEGLSLTNGITRVHYDWSQVQQVYAPGTEDPNNPRVLCVQSTTGHLQVFSELDFGEEIEPLLDSVEAAAEGKVVRIPLLP